MPPNQLNREAAGRVQTSGSVTERGTEEDYSRRCRSYSSAGIGGCGLLIYVHA
jgi:hypothetical protein